MGQEFYLVREDNQTLFELGKHTGVWREWLGRGNSIVAVDGFEETLAGLIASDITLGLFLNDAARRDSIAGEVDSTMDEAGNTYGALIARRIVEWADGQPFRFASDDECERERWGEAGAPWPVTGTRYSG